MCFDKADDDDMQKEEVHPVEMHVSKLPVNDGSFHLGVRSLSCAEAVGAGEGGLMDSSIWSTCLEWCLRLDFVASLRTFKLFESRVDSIPRRESASYLRLQQEFVLHAAPYRRQKGDAAIMLRFV